MAAETPSMRKNKPHGFMTLLSSAASEWFLIFLLFTEAALSYLLTKFAHYCELETPCLLCSRLDGHFWTLLCTHHKQEISSSVSCSIHSKFADIHGMCEECLMPIAEENKSSPECYKLLVGKSWVDVDRSVLQNLMLNKHIQRGSSDRRTCSCCNKIWRSKSNAERLLELSSSIGFGASKANVKPPLPRAPGRSRFSRRDSLKRLRDKFTGGPLAPHISSAGSAKVVDTLSHVGYTKLKISSDSESEVQVSEDDDDGNTGFRGNLFGKSQYDVEFGGRRSVSKPPVEIEVKPSILDQPNLLDLSSCLSVDDSLIDHGKGEVNLEESCSKLNLSSTPELLSLYGGGPVETLISDPSLPHMSALSVLSELLSICNAPPLSDTETVPKNNIDVVGEASEEEEKEEEKVEEEKEEEEDTSLGKHIADAIAQMKACDSAQTDVYMKPLSHVSDSEVDAVSKHEDESTTYEDSSSSQALPNSVSVKKNDSNYDSSDGATVSDVEGENIIDRLKRQIEHDRSCMNSLYKDLEEERNASAIAANQAMAMITRLQEEKAALHMEALQYLRMMEEQAEYDMEALERANDLLADKEKELQDLEIEVEFYRNNFLDESGVHDIQKLENSPRHDSNNSTAVANKISKANGNCKPVNGLVLDFEDEKMYILQSLRKLEKKLHQSYFSGNLDDMPNGLHVGKLQDLPSNTENKENSLSLQKNISVSNGSPTRDKENECVYEKSDKLSANTGEIDSALFEKEIAELYDRLEALESDRNFVKCTSDLLRNGKDGIELVQEIAHQLQEFRKMEFKKR